MQATNCTKNLMIFVDLTDDWKVFIGRSDIAQQEAWAMVLLPFFSTLSPFSFWSLSTLLQPMLYLSFLMSRVTPPLSLKLYVLKLHFYSKNFSKHFSNQNKSPVRVLRDGVLNHQTELKWGQAFHWALWHVQFTLNQHWVLGEELVLPGMPSGFPGGSVGKNPPANAGDADSIPESGRSPGEGNDNPLQYSSLGNPMDRGAWWATVHGVAELYMT